MNLIEDIFVYLVCHGSSMVERPVKSGSVDGSSPFSWRQDFCSFCDLGVSVAQW